MGWRGEIELRDAENGHACAKRSHQVSVTTKLACALTVVLAAATITVGGSYGYVAIPTAGSVGMTSQVKNVSTVSPSEADGARKKKLRQAPDAVAEPHPRRIDAQTDVDTTIAPKATVKDGDVQSDAPSTPSPTSLPYPTVTPKPTRWIRGCNLGPRLEEASIKQDPDVLSESADKTTQKKLVTSMANRMNEWEVDMMDEWQVEVSKLRGFRAEVEGGVHCDTFKKTQLGRDAIAEALIKQYPDVLKAPADVHKFRERDVVHGAGMDGWPSGTARISRRLG